MYRLHCELRHDSGKVEQVDVTMKSVDDWRDSFDWLVDVYCRKNTVELVPTHITDMVSGGECYRYVPDWASMSEVDAN